MQKPLPTGMRFVTVDEHQPQHTGKFDCEVLDDAHTVFPAQWIPEGKATGFGNEIGPGWRVLNPDRKAKGRRVLFMPASRGLKWRPTPRKRADQGSKPSR